MQAGRRGKLVGLVALAPLLFAARVAPGVAADARLRWSDVAGGEPHGFAWARSVAISASRVFVVGGASNGLELGGAFAVRAYAAKSGALLWQDAYDHAGVGDVPALDDLAWDVAARAGVVVVVGSSSKTSIANALVPERDWLVRAYDATTGEVLWTDSVEGDADRDDLASSVAIAGDTAIVAGTVTSAANDADLVVRAHDLRTGRLAWQVVYDHARGSDGAVAAVVRGRTAFVVGSVTTPGRDVDGAVWAHRVDDGTLLWSDAVGDAASNEAFVDVATDGRRVVAVGISHAGATSSMLVHALHPGSGATLWTDVHGQAGRGDSAFSVTLARDSVLLAGRLTASSPDFTVRALDARTGALRWQRTRDESGGFDGAYAIAQAGGAVFVAGRLADDGEHGYFVASYDVATGAPLWSDLHRGTEGGLQSAYAVAVKNDVVASAGGVAGHIAVRTYRRR